MNGVLRHILGWLCLLIGVAGLVLPVLQGWFFLALGALLLAPDLPLFARLVCWVEARFPGSRRVLRRVRRQLGGAAVPPCDPDDQR